jgi:predicted CXXCH cytochrome family protein
MNPETGIARRTAPLASTELDTCAPCHSRRKPLVANPPVGGKLLDSYLPALLEPGLYFADGQIDGEVFEYGSFVQSAMHRAGVTCSNCHEPHGLRLRAEGNAVCAQCHLPARFDTATHTHHAPGSAGAQCIACHMPTRTYMIVHARHDHSLRVPRPDLSVSIGTPNACTACHADKPAAWAAEKVAAWFPGGRQTQPHFATALQAGRTEAADAERRLDQLILDATQPPIARASALPLLARVATPASLPAITAAIADPGPLVRSAAPRALSPTLPPAAARAALALLADPVRAVRVEAARGLAGTPRQAMNTTQQAALDAATRELVAAELVDADRPESHLNLGLLSLRAGQAAEAEQAYRTALRLDPDFVPALANLADLERVRGGDQIGADLLRRAMQLEPGNAAVRHALGLLLVRQHNLAEALPLLREASGLAPDNARYAYVYGVALNASGAPAQAIAVLEQASRAHPTDREVLFALATIARDQGDVTAALVHAKALLALAPADPAAGALVADLERRQGR